MKAKELRKKNAVELKKELGEAQKKLRELRFKVALKQIKNHREMLLLRKTIARILTVLKEQELLNQLAKIEKKEKTVAPKKN